ncbi:hypothetical protein Ais01nite_26300 [Asanoa ishikariensis]|nr:hypothetical protein Ais01nite_26300 [Asanoa ishikariensis]
MGRRRDDSGERKRHNQNREPHKESTHNYFYHAPTCPIPPSHPPRATPTTADSAVDERRDGSAEVGINLFVGKRLCSQHLDQSRTKRPPEIALRGRFGRA